MRIMVYHQQLYQKNLSQFRQLHLNLLKKCSSLVSNTFFDHHPFITPMGLSLATFFDIPALWATSTTLSTSL